jgi:hypothetical protein
VRPLLALAGALALGLVAGCAGSDGADTAAGTTDAETAAATLAPATEPPPTAPPPEPAPMPAATRPYQLWFSQGDLNLELLWERGPVARAAAATALRLLLTTKGYVAEPYRLDSAIPPGTRLLGIALADGVATVDMSAEFATEGRPRRRALAAAQVVYTATQFRTVRSVRLLVDGSAMSVPAGTSLRPVRRPLTRADYESLLPPIVVESPPSGASVPNPIVVAGSANVFEANVILRVLDARRRELARTFTTATCGSGCRGTFRTAIRFPPSSRGRGFLVAQDDDADGDGQPSYAVTVPVRFAP